MENNFMTIRDACSYSKPPLEVQNEPYPPKPENAKTINNWLKENKIPKSFDDIEIFALKDGRGYFYVKEENVRDLMEEEIEIKNQLLQEKQEQSKQKRQEKAKQNNSNSMNYKQEILSLKKEINELKSIVYKLENELNIKDVNSFNKTLENAKERANENNQFIDMPQGIELPFK